MDSKRSQGISHLAQLTSPVNFTVIVNEAADGAIDEQTFSVEGGDLKIPTRAEEEETICSQVMPGGELSSTTCKAF